MVESPEPSGKSSALPVTTSHAGVSKFLISNTLLCPGLPSYQCSHTTTRVTLPGILANLYCTWEPGVPVTSSITYLTSSDTYTLLITPLPRLPTSITVVYGKNHGTDEDEDTLEDDELELELLDDDELLLLDDDEKDDDELLEDDNDELLLLEAELDDDEELKDVDDDELELELKDVDIIMNIGATG